MVSELGQLKLSSSMKRRLRTKRNSPTKSGNVHLLSNDVDELLDKQQQVVSERIQSKFSSPPKRQSRKKRNRDKGNNEAFSPDKSSPSTKRSTLVSSTNSGKLLSSWQNDVDEPLDKQRHIVLMVPPPKGLTPVSRSVGIPDESAFSS